MLLFMIRLLILSLLQSFLTSDNRKFRLYFQNIIVHPAIEIKNTIEIPIHHFTSNTMNALIMRLVVKYHLNRYI